MRNIVFNIITKILSYNIKFILLLAIYIALVIWCTVLVRPVGYHAPQLELFWSYKKWFAGSWVLGKEILGNIGMFIPFGFLLTAGLSSRKNQFEKVFLCALLFSCLIEILQLKLLRGLFEFDDIFNNTLGAILGLLIYRFLHKLIPSKFVMSVLLLFGILLVVCGIVAGMHVFGVI